MKQRLKCLVALMIASVIAFSCISGVAFATDDTSDAPPTVYWLEGDYDVATYMGNGVVFTGKQYLITQKNGYCGIDPVIINLNSEIIFPMGEVPWLDEYFYGDYLLTRQNHKFGLLDQFGKMAVPAIYDTEEEAWQQVNMDPDSRKTFPYSEEPHRVDMMADIDYLLLPQNHKFGLFDKFGEIVVPAIYDTEEEAWQQVNIDPASRKNKSSDKIKLLYGFKDGDGNLLVDYQFDDAMSFDGDNYTWVNKDGRIGLLKNPLKADVMSEWAKEEVTAAIEKRLVPSRCAGYYIFEITRSQMAALLVRYCELVQGEELPVPTEHPFTDTSDTYIEKAYAAGIVQGVAEGIFAPDKVATREQCATMLYRAITKINLGWAKTVSVPDGYKDFDEVSDWAKEAVADLIDKKVMNGVSVTKISPKSYCSTEQAIVLVNRLIQE